jgi:lipoprotein NlpD
MTLRMAAAGAMLSVLMGCASPTHRAPVEDRAPGRAGPSAPATPPPAATADAPKLPLGSENLGKPGYYAVKPGDTLMRIGLETGQNWRDIGRWNGIDNPHALEVGQVLRVLPPGVDPSVAAPRAVPGVASRVEARPLDAKPATGGVAASAATPATPAASPAANPVAGGATAREGDDDIAWAWPASGNVLASFDEVRTKGLVFGGKAGDPVLAAADGRVIYAGSGLRGYGNMVIVKHNNSYLTAYAHNQALLVKEDQVVRKGQKIAEMGSSDAERVQLHFEIRRLGKPVDPGRLLPPR